MIAHSVAQASQDSTRLKLAVRTGLRWFAKHSTPISAVSILVYAFMTFYFAAWVPTATELEALLFPIPFLIVGVAAAVIVILRNTYEMMNKSED